MMKLSRAARKAFFTLLFFTLAVNVTSAQTPKEVRDIPALFKDYYNAEQPDSIYNMFAESARANFPLDKTRAFLIQVNNRYGHMDSLTFLENKTGFAIYKAVFAKGVLSFHLSTDKDNALTALYGRPYEVAAPLPGKRNLTPMHLPVKGEWTVFWGGDTKELNYHVVAGFQKNAFDIVIMGRDGKSFRTEGKTNEDYYAFGQELKAPCQAEVVAVVDGIKDNLPGKLNPLYAPGNAIFLKTKNDEYILFAHIKLHSIKVKQGQLIRQGEILGLCGNSGNSTEPHLHFHLQDKENLNEATGIKCYFSELNVNGVVKKEHSPIKGERIK